MLASRPLAAKMYERFDECFDRYHNAFGGDEMISRCAAFAGGKTKQTITTMEKGMHRAYRLSPSLPLVASQAKRG